MIRVEFKKKEQIKLSFEQLQVGELFSTPTGKGVYMKLSPAGQAVILKTDKPQYQNANSAGTVMQVASAEPVVRLSGVLECELM